MLVQKDVSKYTLIYTSKVNKAGEEWKADESKVTKVNSKNGDYHIDVTETAGNKLARYYWLAV